MKAFRSNVYFKHACIQKAALIVSLILVAIWFAFLA